ncbi:MAG: hypothetical protein ACO1NO_09845 [Burkholderiaceae bacterium]
MRINILLCALLALPVMSFAQPASADLARDALVSVFQRDGGNLVCSPGNVGLPEMKSLLAPFIQDIDLSEPSSYPAVAKAVYAAFPCPFSPRRAELVPATKEDLIGAWVFPDVSVRLRHPPRSAELLMRPSIQHIKCEGILFEGNGEYRVVEVRGQLDCPTSNSLAAMKRLPQVSLWSLLTSGQVKITRTDVPSHFEEWEVFRVRDAFSFASVQFASGDLVAYLRRSPGNNIGASTIFRHLQPAP